MGMREMSRAEICNGGTMKNHDRDIAEHANEVKERIRADIQAQWDYCFPITPNRSIHRVDHPQGCICFKCAGIKVPFS